MLSRKHRVKKSSFPLGANSGRSFFAGPLTLRLSRGDSKDEPVFAVVVSKKVAKTAVMRNRIRRRIYGLIDPFVSKMPMGARCVVYPKKEVAEISFDSLTKSFTEALEQAGIRTSL